MLLLEISVERKVLSELFLSRVGITKRCVRRQKAIEMLTKCILLSVFSEKKNQE